MPTCATAYWLPSSIWVLGLGLIWVGLDTYKQGWHDKLAHTYVLRQHRF